MEKRDGAIKGLLHRGTTGGCEMDSPEYFGGGLSGSLAFLVRFQRGDKQKNCKQCKKQRFY
jgi:hypothetical protein